MEIFFFDGAIKDRRMYQKNFQCKALPDDKGHLNAQFSGYFEKDQHYVYLDEMFYIKYDHEFRNITEKYKIE